MDNAEKLVEFDAEGRLIADPEVLARVRSRQFRLHMHGDTVTLTARPTGGEQAAPPKFRRLSDIADKAERMAALDELLNAVAIANAPSWPENYDLRDDIYD